MYDFLIVGSGFFGSVFAEQAKKAGKKVLVVEQRSHIGGNCFTEVVEGVNVHKYGPHIFHTNSEKVWSYINQFAVFNNYKHQVKAVSGNQRYSLPVNLNTFKQLWGVQSSEEAIRKLNSLKLDIANPDNLEEWCLANVGLEIYEKFFKGYTTKQWRQDPRNLPSSIIQRLPIRFEDNENYFNDRFQGIPIGGYTQIFEKMLDGVEVKLNTPMESDWRKYAKKLVYSGRPDTLLNMKYGELPYLNLNFETKILDVSFQDVAQVNFCDIDIPHTRCIEHNHFAETKCNKTVITFERPVAWVKDAIPYYPVPTKENKDIFEKYHKEIKSQDIILGGRLGKYSYFNMDQVIAQALSISNEILH